MTLRVPLNRISMMPHHTPSIERLFGLMGEQLLFQTNSPFLLAAAQDAFGGYPIPENHAPPLILRLFAQESATDRDGAPELSRANPVYHTQGHLFTVRVGSDNMGAADLRAGFAFGYVNPIVAADRAFVRYAFVECLPLAMLSMARGYVSIHASCVVKGGKAAIVQARAGTGKSTLAYACLRKGYNLLAEDVVHVRTGGPHLELWGTPWNLHLLPDARTLFPELANQKAAVQVNGEWKLELDIRTHFPNQTVLWAEPGPVILLERGAAGKTNLRYLPPRAARKAFEVLWQWDSGWTERYEQEISTLLADGAYLLQMNGSPYAAVDQIDRIIEGRS